MRALPTRKGGDGAPASSSHYTAAIVRRM